MVDLAMHAMDIVQNSIRANATMIEILFSESNSADQLRFSVKDNGSGMEEKTVEKLANPFFTTRTTRKVGLGIPFLKMTSEQTGGNLSVESELGKGTKVEAIYKTDNPDCLPLGDLAGYLVLMLVANPDIHFRFRYAIDNSYFELDTEELKSEGITELSNPEMAAAIKEYVNENLKRLFAYRTPNSFLC